MKLQDQVCTLEQAKRLKELGVKQGSMLMWKCNKVQSVIIDTPMAFSIEKYVPPIGNTYFSAFTVAELGQMLPMNRVLNGWQVHDRHSCGYYDENGKHVLSKFADTEAEARAAMLIYLIENKLVNPQSSVTNQTRV